MIFFRTTIPQSFRISCPIFGLISFLFLGCIVSDCKTVGITTEPTPTWNATWVDRLKRDLFPKYDKSARPAEHFNATTVFFDIQTISDITMDEFKSSMSVQALVSLQWQDEKLKWNESNYGGLDVLRVKNQEIWHPEIRLYNSIAGTSTEQYGDVHCHLYSSGDVHCCTPTDYHARCNLDLRFWPFDTQNCYLHIGNSWVHVSNEVDLQLMPHKSARNLVQQFSQWDLVSITSNLTWTYYTKGVYVTLFYDFSIRRHSPMYYVTVIAPAITIVFLILVIFWLPPESKEKITLCGCTALIISIFLIYFGYKVPPLIEKSPLLVCFYGGCLHIVTISLVISSFVINLSRNSHCRPLPRWITKLLLGRLGLYLGLADHVQLIASQRSIGEQELRECQTTDGNTYRPSNSLSSNCSENGDKRDIIVPTRSTPELEWILAAIAVDRLAFISFLTIFSIMFITCLV